MKNTATHTWREGTADAAKEHIRIAYGDRNTPVCLVQPKGESFIVQFILLEGQANRNVIDSVKKDLDFYLIEKGEPNPWAYARYHCSIAANIYSKVHWILETGDRPRHAIL